MLCILIVLTNYFSWLIGLYGYIMHLYNFLQFRHLVQILTTTHGNWLDLNLCTAVLLRMLYTYIDIAEIADQSWWLNCCTPQTVLFVFFVTLTFCHTFFFLQCQPCSLLQVGMKHFTSGLLFSSLNLGSGSGYGVSSVCGWAGPSQGASCRG